MVSPFLTSEVQERSFMKKKFDAVNFQRKVREKLGEKYSSNRDDFLRKLKEYNGNRNEKNLKHHIH